MEISKEKVRARLLKLEKKDIMKAEDSYEKYFDATTLDSDDTLAIDDLSHKNASEELVHRLDEQIHEHTEHLVLLRNLSFETTDVVEPGALIGVNGRNFIISVSTDSFEVDGQEVMGISEDAPLYLEMAGKKAGYEFKFRNRNFKIDYVR